MTGGAGLLGKALCNLIAREGGLPIVADVDFDGAETVAKEIRASELPAYAVRLDITNGIQIEQVIDEVQNEMGKVDALVNNAYPRSPNDGRVLEEVEYSDFCDSLSRHLGGYFLASQKFAIYFKSQGYGNIVNVASIYGLHAPRFELYEGTPMTLSVAYPAIKAGIIQMTRYFSQYYLRHGVRCNALAPGGIRDNQPAAFVRGYDSMCGDRGLLEPTDLMGPFTFLLSAASKYMTGQVLVVDDGWSL